MDQIEQARRWHDECDDGWCVFYGSTHCEARVLLKVIDEMQAMLDECMKSLVNEQTERLASYRKSHDIEEQLDEEE